MAERRLTIYARQGLMEMGGGVYRVEVNGTKVHHVRGVFFRCDAETDGFEATLTFGIDVADLITAVESFEVDSVQETAADSGAA
jgi:hypothetical protein